MSNRPGNEEVEDFVKHLEEEYRHCHLDLVVSEPVAPVKSKVILHFCNLYLINVFRYFWVPLEREGGLVICFIERVSQFRGIERSHLLDGPGN